MTDVGTPPTFDTGLPLWRELTWTDLETIPDEQYWRYELVDGSLLVATSRDRVHQLCVGEIGRLLADACSAALEVLMMPFPFVPQPGCVLQPDLQVLNPEQSEDHRTVVAPLLVVEVTSPSTRLRDRVLKRAVYAEHGVASYWIVDPSVPSLLALKLVNEAYRVVADVRGEDTATLERPFPVSVTPARLVDRSR